MISALDALYMSVPMEAVVDCVGLVAWSDKTLMSTGVVVFSLSSGLYPVRCRACERCTIRWNTEVCLIKEHMFTDKDTSCYIIFKINILISGSVAEEYAIGVFVI